MDAERFEPVSVSDLLRLWQHRVRYNQRGHYEMAVRLHRQARAFSLIATTIAAATGVLVLLSVRYEAPDWLKIVVAASSLVGAGIAAIQGAWKPAELGAQHHVAAAEYGAALRLIDATLSMPPRDREEAASVLTVIREKLDAISPKAPAIPRQVWESLPPELTPSRRAEARPGVPAAQHGT